METKDIFDFKRFGSYVLTDGKSCINRFGLDVLTMSLVGLGFYLFVCIMHLFGWMEYYHYNHFTSITLMVLLFIAIVLSIGSKCYGYVTDKQAGSLYTLVPVSALEKTLSILIWSFLIPICFLAIYLGIDWLISLVDADYGSCILQMTGNLRDELSLLADEATAEGFNVNFMLNPFTYVDDIMNGILIFVLGALCFKKNKVAMTILAIIAISIVTSSLAAPLLLTGFDPENWLKTAPFFYEHLFLWDTVMDLLGLSGLSVAIYFRLKTIKY